MVRLETYINTNLKTNIKFLSFLGGREHLAIRRSGQSLFMPHAKLKSAGHSLVCIAATYMWENSNDTY